MPPGVPPLNIFRTVGRNPRVLSRMVRGGLLDKGSISMADRELVILRACAVCMADYEWGVHAAIFSDKAGFDMARLADTRACEPNESLWSESQQAVFAMVDSLHDTADIDDALWQRLTDHYTEEQLVELVMLAGLYHAVSFVVNAFKVEAEEFASALPGA
jgi:alkylhydroperoxidase family enzyme